MTREESVQIFHDEVEEVRDPRVDAGESGLGTSEAEGHNTDRVVVRSFREHESAATIALKGK